MVTNAQNASTKTLVDYERHVETILQSKFFRRKEQSREILKALFERAKEEEDFEGTPRSGYEIEELSQIVLQRKMHDRNKNYEYWQLENDTIRRAVSHLRDDLRRYYKEAGTSDIKIEITYHPYACKFVVEPFDALKYLWRGMANVKGDNRPIIIVFSANIFLLNMNDGTLRYAHERKTEGEDEERIQFYTGIGEVMAVHDITQLLDQLKIESHVEPASRFNASVLTHFNVVFLGSPSANEKLKTLTEEPYWKEMSVCCHEVDIKSRVSRFKWEGTEAEKKGPYEFPLWGAYRDTTDYAHILRLTTPYETNLLLLNGLGTFGTQAAAKVVCTDSIRVMS